MLAIAIADEDVAAGFFLQEEGEIFRAHRRFDIRVDLVGPHHAFHHLDGKRRFFRVVDQRRIVALEVKLDFGAKGGRRVHGDLAHALFDQVQHGRGKGAYGANQAGVIRDHIGGAARMDLRDGQHGRI